MTTFLRDEGLDPRCPVIDRAHFGGHARVYDWDIGAWRAFPKHDHILIPMRRFPKVEARALAAKHAGRFKGGNVIVFETEPREDFNFADLLAAYYATKKGKPPPAVVPSAFEYLGLVYTRIDQWREILKPLEAT